MFLIFIRTLYLINLFLLHYCLSDSDIDYIGIPVQFIIDQTLLFLGIACLTLFLPLSAITKYLQIHVLHVHQITTEKI